MRVVECTRQILQTELQDRETHIHLHKARRQPGIRETVQADKLILPIACYSINVTIVSSCININVTPAAEITDMFAHENKTHNHNSCVQINGSFTPKIICSRPSDRTAKIGCSTHCFQQSSACPLGWLEANYFWFKLTIRRDHILPIEGTLIINHFDVSDKCLNP